MIIGAIGHIVMFVTGCLGSLFFRAEHTGLSEMTLWKWLHIRKQQPLDEAASVPQ